jgi:hypothetical protein
MLYPPDNASLAKDMLPVSATAIDSTTSTASTKIIAKPMHLIYAKIYT